MVDRLIKSIRRDQGPKGRIAVLLVDQDVQVAFSLADHRLSSWKWDVEVLQGPAGELVSNPKSRRPARTSKMKC